MSYSCGVKSGRTSSYRTSRTSISLLLNRLSASVRPVLPKVPRRSDLKSAHRRRTAVSIFVAACLVCAISLQVDIGRRLYKARLAVRQARVQGWTVVSLFSRMVLFVLVSTSGIICAVLATKDNGHKDERQLIQAACTCWCCIYSPLRLSDLRSHTCSTNNIIPRVRHEHCTSFSRFLLRTCLIQFRFTGNISTRQTTAQRLRACSYTHDFPSLSPFTKSSTSLFIASVVLRPFPHVCQSNVAEIYTCNLPLLLYTVVFLVAIDPLVPFSR